MYVYKALAIFVTSNTLTNKQTQRQKAHKWWNVLARTQRNYLQAVLRFTVALMHETLITERAALTGNDPPFVL